jgi:arylsulfatase
MKVVNWFAALPVLVTCLLGMTAQAQQKPNIVVMMTDNQGYGDLNIYGGVRADTPSIDRLASEGIQFMDFQVEPGCTQTRAAFMTGRMPIRSGTDMFGTPGQPGGLHPKEVTIAELMKGAGYATANYGKWHLGEFHERFPAHAGFRRMVWHRQHQHSDRPRVTGGQH